MLVSQDLFSLCRKIRDQSHELKLSGNIRQQFIGYNEASASYHKGYLSIQVISNYRYIDHVGRPIYIRHYPPSKISCIDIACYQKEIYPTVTTPWKWRSRKRDKILLLVDVSIKGKSSLFPIVVVNDG